LKIFPFSYQLANLPESEVEKLPESTKTGVYYGFAQVRNQVFEMVMSIGWNPYYKNEKKTAVFFFFFPKKSQLKRS